MRTSCRSVVGSRSRRVLAALAPLALAVGRPVAAQPATPTPPSGQRVSRVALEHALPALDGATLKATVIEVTYPPGAASAPHSHPCPVLGYVARGAVRMKFNDEPETVYKTGETFYEAPNGRHLVSANASTTEPAVLVATLLCDGKAGPLSVPVRP